MKLVFNLKTSVTGLLRYGSLPFLIWWLFLMKGMGTEETIFIDETVATGGTKAADQALYLSAAAPVNEEILWTLPRELPVGFWKITVNYRNEGGNSSNYILAAKSGEFPTLNFYFVRLNKGKGSYTIVSYISKPTSSIYGRKSSDTKKDSFAIKSLEFQKLESTEINDQLPLYFKVTTENGMTTVPEGLPIGNYQINATNPLALEWQCREERFQTAAVKAFSIHVSSPLQKVIATGVTELLFEYAPKNEQSNFKERVKGELIKTVDLEQMETEILTVISEKPTERVGLAIFPFGKKSAFYTTWDDGPREDLIVGALLKKYNVRGTFEMNRGSAMIAQLESLEALGMEIGSHSWNHFALYRLSPEQCVDEVKEMRVFLEQRLKHPVISYAYPFGYKPSFDREGDYSIRALEKAGYWSGRIVGEESNKIDEYQSTLAFSPNFHWNVDPSKIQSEFAASQKTEGSVFHLWGHSYEIASEGIQKLEQLIQAVSGKEAVWYTTQGEIFVWRWIRQNTKISKLSANSFQFQRPWLHPYLRSFPMTIQLPEGVTAVSWKEKTYPVLAGEVHLPW